MSCYIWISGAVCSVVEIKAAEGPPALLWQKAVYAINAFYAIYEFNEFNEINEICEFYALYEINAINAVVFRGRVLGIGQCKIEIAANEGRSTRAPAMCGASIAYLGLGMRNLQSRGWKSIRHRYGSVSATLRRDAMA